MPERELTTRELYDLLKKAQDDQTEKLMKEIAKYSEEHNNKLKNTQKSIENLQDKSLLLERKGRKNNIVIFGLQIKDNILEETIKELNHHMELNIRENDINNIYVIGKQENKKGILIEFISFLTKQKIFKNFYKLKNTKIVIVNDLCPEDQQKQKILTKHLVAARNKNKTAKIRGFKLEIDKKLYSIEELEGEETDNEIISEAEETDEEEEAAGKKINKGKSKSTIKKQSKKENRVNKINPETQTNTRFALKK